MSEELTKQEQIVCEFKYLSNPEKFCRVSESIKFNSTHEIESALKSGKILNRINIDEIKPELSGMHSNLVELAEINMQYLAQKETVHLHQIKGFQIEHNGKVFKAIYKPASGEDNKTTTQLGIHDCYLREVAAYQLDNILKFGIVPPTVIKEDKDDIGSLQLYVEEKTAENHIIMSNQVDFEKESSGKDWQLMAVFDYIMANWDRKPENWLVDKRDNSILYAIDHGFSFYSRYLNVDSVICGPRRTLTYNNKERKSIRTPLPDFIIERLMWVKESKIDKINKVLTPLVPEFEIEQLLIRIDKLLETKILIKSISID